MEDVRSTFRAILFSIVGVIIALLVFRIGFDLIGANPNNAIVELLNNVTDWLISPFKDIVSLPELAGMESLNVDAIMAIGIYVLGAIAFSEVATSFMYDSAAEILQNFIDGVFKIIEFLIFLRILFSFFGIFKTATSPGFINTVYGLTEWTQIVEFRPGFLNGVLDVSAVIMLIIVVTLDLLTERFLDGIFSDIESGVKSVKKKFVFKREPAPKVVIPNQNITINVPMPPPNNVVVQQPPKGQ